MTQRRHFFALPDDLLPVFDAVEAKTPVAYTLTGMFDAADAPFVRAGSLLPSLHFPAESTSSSCPTYLVTLGAAHVQLRAVSVRSKGIRYAVDQLANPESVVLTHGGFDAGGVLISGRVATASDAPAAKRLQASYAAAIGKTFKRVNAYWVGPRAMDHLRGGGRLTHSAASPAKFDLALTSD